jgi:hypothetical protein
MAFRNVGPVYASRRPTATLREPKPEALAREIAKRCERNMRLFEKKSGHRIEWSGPNSVRESTAFSLNGRSREDDANWQAAHIKHFGWKPEKGFSKGSRYMPGSSAKPKLYGYRLHVTIKHEPFNLQIRTEGRVPEVILRCLDASFNELAEQYT